MKSPNDPREQAVCKVARDIFAIELDMEHRETARPITATELRRALELAYDLGRKSLRLTPR